jgi:nicotinate dehydrogenase subunit B
MAEPPGRSAPAGNTRTGHGLAYAQRNGTVVAIIAEVDSDRPTGKIWARKFTVAHDFGQIINADALAKCIEGNIVQGVSRALWEESVRPILPSVHDALETAAHASRQ